MHLAEGLLARNLASGARRRDTHGLHREEGAAWSIDAAEGGLAQGVFCLELGSKAGLLPRARLSTYHVLGFHVNLSFLFFPLVPGIELKALAMLDEHSNQPLKPILCTRMTEVHGSGRNFHTRPHSLGGGEAEVGMWVY